MNVSSLLLFTLPCLPCYLEIWLSCLDLKQCKRRKKQILIFNIYIYISDLFTATFFPLIDGLVFTYTDFEVNLVSLAKQSRQAGLIIDHRVFMPAVVLFGVCAIHAHKQCLRLHHVLHRAPMSPKHFLSFCTRLGPAQSTLIPSS